MKQKYIIPIFLSLSFLFSMAANFAHPITPTLMVELKMPSYMFGAAFAAMSFTNFLFSPFWGKMRDFFSAKTLLLIGSIGYGFGQYAFSISQSKLDILLARCLSGFFVGALNVSLLIYLIEISDSKKTGENLAKLSIIQTVGGAAGFFIGGAIGVYSIPQTFLIQFIVLEVLGLLFFFLLTAEKKKAMKTISAKTFIREINPLKSFLDTRSFMTISFVITFSVVTLSSFATSAFDQNFNYYLKAHFGYSSIYNGVLKAATGIITLLVVSVVGIRILKKEKIKKATGIVLAGCGICVVLLLMAENILPFFGFYLLFFGFNALFTPLLQESITRESNDKSRNLVMGLYNSTRSLGMIGGALLAGVIYNYGPRLPFLMSAVCFFVSAAVMIWVAIRYEGTSEHL